MSNGNVEAILAQQFRSEDKQALKVLGHNPRHYEPKITEWERRERVEAISLRIVSMKQINPYQVKIS